MTAHSSFNKKILTAFNLSIDITDIFVKNPAKESPFSIATLDMLWGHADGLTAKWLYSRRDGCCSIHAAISFDPKNAENTLDTQINAMKTILNKLN